MTGFALTFGLAPAPPAIVEAVQQIEVECSIDVASAFTLRLGLSRTALGDWSPLESGVFRPLLEVGVRVQLGTGLPEAILNGFVGAQQVVYSDQPGEAALEVTGMDATMLMNLEDKVTPWQNMPDGTIAARIFGQHRIVPRVQTTSPVLVEPEGQTMQRGSDIRFLRRLARRNGFDCYVQPEPITGLDQGFFAPPSLTGAPLAVLNVAMGTDTNVEDFSVAYDMTRPTTVDVSGVDSSTTPSAQPAVATSALLPAQGAEPALARLSPAPVARPAQTGLTRTGDLQTLAQAIVDRSSLSVTASGSAGEDVGVLRPGGIVNVRGAGRELSGSYYLTRVRHTIGRDSYEQRFEAVRNAVGLTGAELFVEV
jgi:phage protein D